MVSDEFENYPSKNIDVDNCDLDVRKRICVIGVGAAGLCALRHLQTKLEHFDIIAYERDDDIGGTWKYSEHVGTKPDGFPVYSSMYKNLFTNLPLEIMGFPDFTINTPHSYVHHTVILNYLHQYANKFNLYRFINFNHFITNVCHKNNKWSVTIKNIKENSEFTKYFDYILICTGRYSLPHWPKFDTITKFNGKLLHSHDYRQPDDYQDECIAVIGGGLSGVDISQECSKCCEKVIFINNGETKFQNMHPNVLQINVKVEGFDKNSMIVRDKNKNIIKYNVDTVIMATGYIFNLNFLDKNVGITMNTNGTINGLYRHFINIENPTMFLFAVNNQVLPMPLYHQQLLYLMKILMGEYQLPSKKEMIQDTEEDYRQRIENGLRPKDFHTLKVDMMEKYLDKLAKESNTKPLQKNIIKLHRDLYSVRRMDISNYKRFDYRLINDDRYIAIDKNTGLFAYNDQQGFLHWYYKHHPIGSKIKIHSKIDENNNDNRINNDDDNFTDKTNGHP